MSSLHAFGSNGSGQLGIGHHEDVSLPEPCLTLVNDSLKPIPADEVVSIVAGGNHTLVLLKDGSLLGSGDNSQAQIHETSMSSGSSTFRRAELGEGSVEHIRLVSASWTCSTFVTDSGVFSRGYGPKGELGLGANMDMTTTTKRLSAFPPESTVVADIKACVSHTVVLLSNGDVYGWGNGRKGQLGPSANIVWEPRKIHVPFKPAAIACGREFSIFVAPPGDDRIFVLGSDKHQVISTAPASISGWKSLVAGWCSVHVLAEGRLLSWGRADRGQLAGSGTKDVGRIAAGSEHALVCLLNGATIAWGWGEHGNCGPDHDEHCAHTIFIQRSQPSFIAAGCATSFVAF